jgi:hypothetical protein
MTVSSSDIALESPYAVSDVAGSKFTTAEFDRLFTRAQSRLDREAPASMSSDDRDRAHLMLICHMHAVKLGEVGLRSESIGAYSYTKDSGTSSYLEEYRELISAAVGSDLTSGSGGERIDAEMDDMDLDQSVVPRYTEGT